MSKGGSVRFSVKGFDPGTNGNGVFCLVIDVQSLASFVGDRRSSNSYGDAATAYRPRRPV